MKKVLDIFGVGGASAITDKNYKKKNNADIRLENEIERAMHQYGMKQNEGGESNRVTSEGLNGQGASKGFEINHTIQDPNNSHISM